MTDLKAIISTFSIKEQQQFLNYLEKKNKRNDTKNSQLFKLLAKNESSDAICFKLYKTKKKDAYHALRKRLYQSLIDFIANSKMEEENSVDMQLIKYILAARTFFLHEQSKVAIKFLIRLKRLPKNIISSLSSTKFITPKFNMPIQIPV